MLPPHNYSKVFHATYPIYPCKHHFKVSLLLPLSHSRPNTHTYTHQKFLSSSLSLEEHPLTLSSIISRSMEHSRNYLHKFSTKGKIKLRSMILALILSKSSSNPCKNLDHSPRNSLNSRSSKERLLRPKIISFSSISSPKPKPHPKVSFIPPIFRFL